MKGKDIVIGDAYAVIPLGSTGRAHLDLFAPSNAAIIDIRGARAVVQEVDGTRYPVPLSHVLRPWAEQEERQKAHKAARSDAAAEHAVLLDEVADMLDEDHAVRVREMYSGRKNTAHVLLTDLRDLLAAARRGD